ncbi:hypothetical protein LHJ74_20055 [Streptomyces sp. N2-109]|uniref:Uncharacterized protein n=1 Tax=Streptomyces gossypii TaxID=2883101 RepID=A0ABT2JW94_9ACTN|nr:hypothetical protein [Streptomyces gossypii]MCT2592170.1 hypothetical protein [Streptomyces gossypii]
MSEVEVLYDKHVTLIGSGGSTDARLLGSQLPGTRYHYEYMVSVTRDERVLRGSSWNFYSALVMIRRELEADGLRPAVMGALVNVHPSRMALDMGGGMRAYYWESSPRPRTVDIFDEVPPAEYFRLASVEEQRAWFELRMSEGNAT